MASEEETWAYTTDQEDFDDFFSPEPDLEGALAPVDFYAGKVRLACQHGNRQVTSADQRLAKQEEQEEIRITPEYEFDR